MASLTWHESSKAYHIVFRHDGRQYRRSLGALDEATARGVQGRIEETLSLVRLGRISVPPVPTLATGLSPMVGGPAGAGGRNEVNDDRRHAGGLRGRASRGREGGQHPSHREDSPQTHLPHPGGRRTARSRSDLAAAQRYVKVRLGEVHGRLRQRPIRPYTARKELRSFRTVWGWWAGRNLVPTAPTWQIKQVTLPRDREPEPFRTMAEILRRIARGGLSPEDEKMLLDALYLTGPEIRGLLDHAREPSRPAALSR